MSKFSKPISQFISCEVTVRGKASCFAKLDNGRWVAVLESGDLDWVEIDSIDFSDMLESLESIGASVRFTNHSAA